MSSAIGQPQQVVEVFYDGQCPLCLREIRLLLWLDSKRRIAFTDIAADDFEADAYGFTQEQFMAEIQGRLPDGTWITGVEVFRRLYGAVGFGPLVGLSRLPGLSHLLDVGYRFFAKYRLPLTGRCQDDSCRLK